MVLEAQLATLRAAGKNVLLRATTLARVGRQTGLLHTLNPGAALAVLGDVARGGKSNPSLIFKYHRGSSPDRLGLVAFEGERERAFSFREMDDTIERFASALAKRGVGPGSAVIFMLKNRAELVLGPPAVSRIGGAAVSVSWRSTPPELVYLARHSGARAVVFDAELEAVVRKAMTELPDVPRENFIAVTAGGAAPEGFATWDDVVRTGEGPAPRTREADGAVVSYTSGTTGKPKGAVRKFESDAAVGVLSVIGETPLRAREVHLCVCPLYHATAYGFAAIAYLLGNTVVVLPDFKPQTFLDAIEKYRVASVALVPTMLYRLAELDPAEFKRRDLSSLRAVFSGGGPLTGSLAKEMVERLGPVVFNFYGATETGIVTIASSRDLVDAPNTIGRAIPSVEIRLLDDDGREVPEGEVGELYARSSMLVAGYHKDQAATDSSMRDGFFSVGDLARRDAEGRYFLEGRKRDMVISGGVNVYPAEVEAALEAHPAVREAAVIGVPDDEWGERVRAFVVLRAGSQVDAPELVAFCKSSLAGPKVPREIVVVPALPKNPTGKILKRELRDLAP